MVGPVRRALGIVAAHPHGGDSRPPAGFDVPVAVAHRDAAPEVDAELLRSPQQQPGLRPAIAAVGIVVRADEDSVQAQLGGQVLVDGVDLVLVAVRAMSGWLVTTSSGTPKFRSEVHAARTPGRIAESPTDAGGRGLPPQG